VSGLEIQRQVVGRSSAPVFLTPARGGVNERLEKDRGRRPAREMKKPHAAPRARHPGDGSSVNPCGPSRRFTPWRSLCSLRQT